MLLYVGYMLVFGAAALVIYSLLTSPAVDLKNRFASGIKNPADKNNKASLWFQKNFKGFFKARFLKSILEGIAWKLEKAGLSDDYSAEDYLCVHLAGGGIGLLLSTLASVALISSGSVEDFGLPHALGLVMLFTGIGIFAPAMRLNEMIKARKKSILRSLPFTLDLITVSVEAGMDFGGAIQRIIDRGEMNELNYEFYLFTQETRLGKRKVEALDRMAQRIDIPSVTSILGSLIQAEELGMRVGQILRIQSQSLRTKRMQTAEKAALEAPVKMLIPLALFIFPAVFIVLLGPMVLQFISK